MTDKYFPAAPGVSAGDAAASRVLWSGRCAVAEYAFEEPNSLPRWTLPEETEVVVTDDRVIYRDVSTGATGDLRWPWPQHLRVQPGNRDSGRSATVTQIQLVCAGPGGTFPALVLAGGDIATVGDADRLANVLRQTIARYRVEHAAELGIPAPQGRMLSRLVIGPEFSNYQGGEGQTVTLLGAISVQASQAVPRPRPIYGSAAVPAPVSAAPVYEPVAAAPEYAPVPAYEPAAAEWPVAVHAEFGTSPPQTLRPGFDADTASRPARPADDTVLRGAPDLATRAADLAARVANLVAGGDYGQGAAESTNLSAYLGSADDPADRAEQIRRTAARLTTNSARSRGLNPRRPADDEIGSRTRPL
ncbi:translation initiation factor 2 [Paractinoplanes durhamensis]|uniref:Translation initiation factor 2 n=1 Tax=Paractinoplanes durhamensis TaxID=113563 RepID=A0ABQ3YNZ4_9ACTN|nr:translation initiation factor 2 [Actinoplanes durhamensis]GID99286.1 hypothetical protein Adu01nite_06370 [Actinoplanes durhamensis]